MCSNPYLDSEWESFVYISDLSKIVNIFKGTKLIRTPKGFLKDIQNQTVPSADLLSSILSGSSIIFFNHDLMIFKRELEEEHEG